MSLVQLYKRLLGYHNGEKMNMLAKRANKCFLRPWKSRENVLVLCFVPLL